MSRRIQLEYNFFKGLANSHIFNAIMVLITALQAIIMQTPINYIFKVRRGECRRDDEGRGRAGASGSVKHSCVGSVHQAGPPTVRVLGFFYSTLCAVADAALGRT